jgi:hypothetical protein
VLQVGALPAVSGQCTCLTQGYCPYMLLPVAAVLHHHCCCFCQGVLSLAAAPSIGQLQQLDLSHNGLGPAAGSGLAELLGKATSLQRLKLKSTQLQDEGRHIGLVVCRMCSVPAACQSPFCIVVLTCCKW